MIKDYIIGLDNVVKRNSDHLLASNVGEELVMMDIDGGNYISLNKVGRIIWEQIEEPLKVNDLICALLTRFNVSEEQCQKETLEYLQNMLAQNIINFT